MIIKQDSDNYGSYYCELVGIFSPACFFKHAIGNTDDEKLDFVCNWIAKFHPRNFFCNYTIVHLARKDNSDLARDNFQDFAVFVPSERANLEWYNENTELAKTRFKKIKKLPIQISTKKIEQWQSSFPNSVLIPEHLMRVSSIEDLRRQYLDLLKQ